ncbi:peptidyl-prolyl cis-trans isomerase [Pseudodesulfovibrio sp. F-1]|uniref:Peptidyl-prolyl cis-trans isomerase n=1 Tax=Pseudodesulfovibrio alkaliphilus TaxID=2661613 RepID=A0A7K1KRC4_9BACT|nr:peptidylprolyl isomerase [Pseudodesulfovibrio alkaliphilus]MUM78411.1 peptidyl-prolyl cis-trans isomerase [Pseudodesulfovibrio alkaliphilus]
MFRNLAVFILTLALLAGCSNTADEIGVVARVNGAPIYLSQLEFQHDQFQVDAVGGYVPSVENLKNEYGEILAELIVQELVVQELEKRDIGVSDHEMLKAEEEVRADYPEGAFDQMLVEEYIDLKAWRLQLRNHLAMRKFFYQVLRPQIKIDYREAEQYYRDRISDFYLPESLRILVVRGPSREIVGKAVERFLAERDHLDLTTAFGEVETRDVMIREERLSATWKNALTGVAPGQASGVLTDRFGFEALVLLERSPAKVLEPAQAYPLVENALVERKLHDAFDAWLDTAMARARISLSSHLLSSEEFPQLAPLPMSDPEDSDGAEPEPLMQDLQDEDLSDDVSGADESEGDESGEDEMGSEDEFNGQESINDAENG